MGLFLLLIIIVLVVLFLFSSRSEISQASNNRKEKTEDAEWEFGDAWKQGSPDDVTDEEQITYVEILRKDTGEGYDDSVMLDLVGYLSSRGVRATYDAVSIAFEFGGAIKTYVLKVEAGKEEDAKAFLREKEQGPR